MPTRIGVLDRRDDAIRYVGIHWHRSVYNSYRRHYGGITLHPILRQCKLTYACKPLFIKLCTSQNTRSKKKNITV